MGKFEQISSTPLRNLQWPTSPGLLWALCASQRSVCSEQAEL